jgi:competence protein ComEC
MGSGRPSRIAAIGVVFVVVLSLAHRGEIRARAEDSLGWGMPAREAALARGFVLGEDERIDSATVEDFRRAGLSHLLAVSGQNIALLVLLAMPLLAVLGMPLKTRLVWILGAIAFYVSLAGAGPSVLRAGVMGGLSVLATLAGRRASRLYALMVAAAVTLALDPGLSADVGWQLSFAAVLGILALARPLRAAIATRFGDGGLPGAVAEGVAVTLAATLATAPLIALHFESVSTMTVVANLLALPAVAPAMWLGMLTTVGAQVPGFPVAALNALDAPLLAYVAQVAAWCGRPSWAYLHVRIGIGGLIGSYALLLGAAVAIPVLIRRRRVAALRRGRSTPLPGHLPAPPSSPEVRPRRRKGVRRLIALALAGSAAIVLACLPAWGGADSSSPGSGLRISFLDVGQGDAILLQPARAPAVLVDGGPPGDGLAAKLSAAGVERLGIAIVTHDQSDHAGGIEELLGRFPVAHLAYARISRGLRDEARVAGIGPLRIAAGSTVRSGRLSLEVLWPPRELFSTSLAGADPNTQALVMLARWRHFSMLLTADAEAEAVPLNPGPVDVLKVAHHGSEDTGLDSLLTRTDPKLAVISVGADNPYGHPAPATLAALAAHDVSVMRTDLVGTIVLDVRALSAEVHDFG